MNDTLPMYPEIQHIHLETGDPALHLRSRHYPNDWYPFINQARSSLSFANSRRTPYPYIVVGLKIVNPLMVFTRSPDDKKPHIRDAVQNASHLTQTAIEKMFQNPLIYDPRQPLHTTMAEMLGVNIGSHPTPRKDEPLTNMLQCDQCNATIPANYLTGAWRTVTRTYPYPHTNHFCTEQCEVNHILANSDQPIVIDPAKLRKDSKDAPSAKPSC